MRDEKEGRKEGRKKQASNKAKPGAKVRMITREARYCAKTHAFASCYAVISQVHATGAIARKNN